MIVAKPNEGNYVFFLAFKNSKLGRTYIVGKVLTLNLFLCFGHEFFFFFLTWLFEVTQNEPYHISFLMKHNHGFKTKNLIQFWFFNHSSFKTMYMTHAILRFFFYMVSIKTWDLARVKVLHSRF